MKSQLDRPECTARLRSYGCPKCYQSDLEEPPRLTRYCRGLTAFEGVMCTGCVADLEAEAADATLDSPWAIEVIG